VADESAGGGKCGAGNGGSAARGRTVSVSAGWAKAEPPGGTTFSVADGSASAGARRLGTTTSVVDGSAMFGAGKCGAGNEDPPERGVTFSLDDESRADTPGLET